MLTGEEVKELRIAHKQQRDKRLADRIKAILLLHEGFTYEQIAKILLLDDVTVRRYEKHYQEKKIEGLLECHYHGRNWLLTKVQEQELVSYLKSHTCQSVKEVVEYVGRIYQVHYSIDGMTHLLHRLKFVYKKTKVVPGKV